MPKAGHQQQDRATRWDRGMEHLCYKAERIGNVQPGKEKALESPNYGISVPEREAVTKMERNFFKGWSYRTRGNLF